MQSLTRISAAFCFLLPTLAIGQQQTPADGPAPATAQSHETQSASPNARPISADQPPQMQGIPAMPGDDAPASSSLLVVTPIAHNPNNDRDYQQHALRDVSMFAIAPPEPHEFVVHDLVQVIVRETSSATSSQDLKTKKESNYDGEITNWPMYGWSDFLYDDNSKLAAAGLDFTKDFKGEGDYSRKDDLTARITAEVIEVLPNGNLVIEARTYIKTDKEEQTMKVTGICRPQDISPLNTILSNQIHDLTVEKVNKGAIKDAANKGLFTKALDFIFAF